VSDGAGSIALVSDPLLSHDVPMDRGRSSVPLPHDDHMGSLWYRIPDGRFSFAFPIADRPRWRHSFGPAER